MGRSKFWKFVFFGALVGAILSMLDRSTREQATVKSKNTMADVKFYTRNPKILKTKVQEKAEKIQSVYEQFSEDASFIKEKVAELKELTPQVKDLVVDTKDTFVESKDEYKSIVKDELGN